MRLVPLLMLLADDDTLIAAARERTRAEMPCATSHRSDDILVCGRREADRYRVSLVTSDIRDAVPIERSRLLDQASRVPPLCRARDAPAPAQGCARGRRAA
ncbi:hypothetical protein [Sphingomonas sp. DT-204]|uniref:hypothetical protein n=1 Tax=Sphingomonas sp. DT-204 TaxID=3396166 RepID=UPI003F19D149